MAKIKEIKAREVLDSRGFPTVEADVVLDDGSVGRAISPSGASTGTHEALELRDGDKSRYLGKGVLKAVRNVVEELAPKLKGEEIRSQREFDQKLLEIEGSENKTRLGANAVLAVSLAGAKAAALSRGMLLAEWIYKQAGDIGYSTKMSCPIPMMNVINGGAHADNGLDIQEFMIVPHGFDSFSTAIRAGCEVFHSLKKTLSERGLVTAVGDEGGFAPRLSSNEEALALIMEAIEKAGYRAGSQISVALDVASSEFYQQGRYQFREKKLGTVDAKGLIEYYRGLCDRYPLVSIEDGFAEDDWAGWTQSTTELGSRIQLVGDDLFVTQKARLEKGVEQKAANAILIKLNQVGTLWETLETMKYGQSKGVRSVVSHRSGETEDTSLAHLVVGTGAGQVKTGSASRTDRIAKYNELLRLEEALGLKLAASPYHS